MAAAVAATVLTLYVAGHPFIPEDAAIERDVQSIDWGPLTLTFPIFNWIGDSKGFFLEFAILLVIIAFNRPAWLIAVGAGMTAVIYLVLSHYVLRPRPTTAEVLRVTEHPGASSFPSGHTIFICTLMTVLVVCYFYRFFEGRLARALLWTVAALAVIANGICLIYTGAHWPTDVLAGLLIAVAWLGFWLSWGAVSRRVWQPSAAPPEVR